jgi:hypothetical protein
MPEHTFADLLAGVIDLAPSTPPHGPGPCPDLCVPGCAQRSETTPAEARPDTLVGSAAG